MATDFMETIRLLFEDVVRHRVFVVLTFLLIGCAGLVVGLNWPKIYTSSTSIYVEEENILGPLMEGAAVQTEVIDRSSIARDILYGRKILLRVLAELGISDEATDPVKQERIMEEIKGRTLVTGGRNLIRIEYSDSDPEKAFEITRLLAELFIAESLADKARESQSAYDFINQQVEEYKAKLVASEDQLKKFRSENADVVSGMGQEIGRQITELNNQVETIAQELNEARITRDSLVRQLTGQAQTFSAFSQAEENRTRIGELQAQLDTLRLSYHETYPDIVRIKAQIADLRQAIARDEQRPPTGGAGGQVRLDERALANPLYQELQGQLYDTNTLIRTLESRLARARETLRNTIARSKDTQEYEAQLAELARDYEVNKEIYADMTRRRESARVSMNLDREQKGLTLRVDEPAFFPHKPSGLQFLHFVIGSPLLGLIIPLGALFVVRQLDPRIRSATQISRSLDIHVLGVVPHLATVQEARRESAGLVVLGVVLLVGIGVMGSLVFMHLQGQI